MIRVRSLGLPAVSKARIANSLYSVGLYGAEVGGMSASRMNDVRISARKALGKGANLRRSSPLELMAYGGPGRPAGDPQRKLQTGTLNWPSEESAWKDALAKERGRGPMQHLKRLANRLGWTPQPGGWHSDGQYFTWHEMLLTDVAQGWPGFAGLETSLSTKTFRHLKKFSNKRDDRTRSAVNAALGGVWLTGLELELSGLTAQAGSARHMWCWIFYTDTQERVWLPLPGLKQFV
eukprot:6369906-Amphidinium_carterae.1